SFQPLRIAFFRLLYSTTSLGSLGSVRNVGNDGLPKVLIFGKLTYRKWKKSWQEKSTGVCVCKTTFAGLASLSRGEVRGQKTTQVIFCVTYVWLMKQVECEGSRGRWCTSC
ncbi:unnamed protein product, partial [Choristocarpus tenellus]